MTDEGSIQKYFSNNGQNIPITPYCGSSLHIGNTMREW
jgi:hypothetical protein